MIVAETSYETSDPTIDSQIVKLKTSAPTWCSTPRRRNSPPRPSRRSPISAWKPVHILDINSVSVGAVMQPAGLENSKGVISTIYGKDPADPTWKDDAGMKKYLAFMAKYYPEGDKDSLFNTYGYSTTPDADRGAEALRRRSHPRERHEAGDLAQGRHHRPGAAGHRRLDLADRLPRQQAVADDAVQRRTLGSCSARSSRTTRRAEGFNPLPFCAGRARLEAPTTKGLSGWTAPSSAGLRQL